MPFTMTNQFNDAGQYAMLLSSGRDDRPLPNRSILLVTALVTLAYFWPSPDAFPCSMARRSEELRTIGWVVVLAAPR